MKRLIFIVLQAKGITHVLSVDEKPLPDILTSKINYKHMFALDLYDFDLLSFFPDCLTFIDQARESGGRVLVHWCVFIGSSLKFTDMFFKLFFLFFSFNIFYEAFVFIV